MIEHDQHSSFIKTPQQLIVILLLSFLVPIIVIILLVQLVINKPSADPNALTPESVAARIQPVGKPAAPKGAAKPATVDGKAVYDKVCFACHAQSVAASPKLGDKAAWAPRIKQGMDTLVQTVTKGKGGNPALTDQENRTAVDFMVSQSK